MFCPDCGTQNEREQKYCRQCGLSLAGVLQTLAGREHNVLAKYRGSETAVMAGATLLSLFTIITLLVLIAGFLSNGVVYTGVLFPLLFVSLISLPLIWGGVVRLHRTNRMLKARSESEFLGEAQPEERVALPGALRAAPLRPGSVTEQTTRELSYSEKRSE